MSHRIISLGAVLVVIALTAEPCSAQEKYLPLKERTVLKGHTEEITSLCFAPDCGTLASSSQDKSIRLWDVKSGKELFAMKGLELPALALRFSPDGKILASGDRGKMLRLWDVKTGKELRALTAHEGGVRVLRFSPDGKTLASTGEDRVLRLWNVGNGQEIKRHEAGGFGAHAIVFSPDGKTLAYGESLWANLLDLGTGKTVVAQEHGNAILDMIYSPDGKLLMTAGHDDKMKLWTVKPLKEKQVFPEGHIGGVASVQFSADGKTLFTAGASDARYLIWDAEKGKVLHSYQMPWRTVAAVAPDGKSMASGDRNAIKMWDVPAK